MNIMAVDDERIALQLLVRTIYEAVPDVQVQGFYSSEEALAYGSSNVCEIAFLDIDMGGMDGISLAKQLKKVNPKVNIIFVTAYIKYAMDALNIHSSGYVTKPVTKEKIIYEMTNLRHPISMLHKHKVWVQCFGNFEIFVDGSPIKFKYSRTKELLAFLIDRKGSFCSNGEIIATLWEDEGDKFKKSSYLRDLSSDLFNTFRTFGIEHLIHKERGVIAIAQDKVSCDYYQWLQGDVQGVNAYHGEYMCQYSWSELTHAGIEKVKN